MMYLRLPMGYCKPTIEGNYPIVSIFANKALLLWRLEFLSFLSVAYIIVGFICLLTRIGLMHVHTKYGRLAKDVKAMES